VAEGVLVLEGCGGLLEGTWVDAGAAGWGGGG
jgi:hypothetical protein